MHRSIVSALQRSSEAAAGAASATGRFRMRRGMQTISVGGSSLFRARPALVLCQLSVGEHWSTPLSQLSHSFSSSSSSSFLSSSFSSFPSSSSSSSSTLQRSLFHSIAGCWSDVSLRASTHSWERNRHQRHSCGALSPANVGEQPARGYAKKPKRKGAGVTPVRVKERGEPTSTAAHSTQNKAGEGVPGTNTCTLDGVGKMVGSDRWLFRDVSLSLFEGAKVGVLGVNGAGKSSLLRVISGEDNLFDGSVIMPSGVRVGYLPQEPRLDDTLNVYENVISLIGVDDEGLLLQLHRAEERLRAAQAVDESDSSSSSAVEAAQDEVEELKKLIKTKKLLKIHRKIGRAMAALRCPPPGSSTESLSGGERRRVALCRLLLSEPDLLLLDEPTNHLDSDSVAWLERFLREYKGSVMAVTHDRYFLDNVAGWILELDRGEVYTFRGNYTGWLENKANRLEMEERDQKLRAKMLQKELEWIRRPPGGRHRKGKARVAAYEKLSEKPERPRPTSARIVIPIGPRLGNIVAELKNVSHSFGDKKILDNVSISLPSGAIIGVVGPNGVGKSTLLALLRGDLQPDSGEVALGSTVDIGYVSQDRAELDPTETVFQAIAGADESEVELGDGQLVDARLYVASFHFRGPDQQKLVGLLSGGERNRVHLAKMLKSGCNVLMLDEPTNDLDVEVLSNLENALLDFLGTAIVISHDRWFLNKICSHLLIFEGDGQLSLFEGSLEEYEASGNSLSGKRPKGAGFISLQD